MEIYISYSWKMPIKAIVKHWLCPSLKEKDINYIIDEKDCGYGHDIEEFEKEIGKADNVLIMLSRRYFYSPNCMFELALMMKNKGYNKRLIWVSADDFERTEKEGLAIYDYWKEEEKKILGELTTDENRNKFYRKNLEKIQLTLEYFVEAWELITRTNTLSFEDISENKFQKLVAYIKNELMIEDLAIKEPNTDLPMEVGDAPKGISVTQYGDKNVTQIITEGTVTINM